jgi:hypothetical protein
MVDSVKTYLGWLKYLGSDCVIRLTAERGTLGLWLGGGVLTLISWVRLKRVNKVTIALTLCELHGQSWRFA